MADKKISELDQTLNLDEQAEFPLSQDNGGTPTTFKAKLTQIATKIIEAITFSNLTTTNKTVIGAINELDAGGGGGGASELNDLDDVDITSPTDGQGLVYDDATDKWVNGDVSADLDITTEITTPAPIISFNDGGDNIPLKSCNVAIVAQQASGTPSPDNPLSISGYSSVNVAVSSKNLWSNGDVSFTGNNTSVNFYQPLPPNTYTISATVTSNDTHATTCALIVYYTDGTNSSVYQFSRGSRTSITLTPSKYIHRLAFYSSDNYAHGGGDTATWADIQVEVGNQMTAYEAPTVHTVPLGQTIYGGTAELVNGNGSDELLAVTYTGQASEDWGQSGEYFYTTLAASVRTSFTVLCSCYKGVAPTSYTNLNNFECAMSDTLANLNIRDNRGLSLADFKTWLSNNPMTIVYKRVTPQSFTFTGANIPTLSGTNNIYADSGDIQSLEYFNDKGDDIAALHNALGEPLHIYSTDEKVVGTWIDGSDVYERVFSLSQRTPITDDYSTVLIPDVSVYGIDKLIDFVGYDNNGSGNLDDLKMTLAPIVPLISGQGALIVFYVQNNAYQITKYKIRYTKSS